ncbi:hypothetical protein [Acetanaerobacterium elongatum]|uniref:Uncharacterized protein n=1 Tax=Acetanaerobacterium elongatum TaxID=258515 RepID=A0A1G9UNR4_9FIRM|nr:hypothetical protein [Acetanaerobacterium elongatum]SDM61484.1 hypothetical protein SAMN05192585_10271 [Acetanaerobacterium elongatum]
MTISNLASSYYNNFAFTGSNTYAKYASKTSAVSKNTFNVSNLSTAFASLENASSSGFSTLQNVDTFVKSCFTFSQLDSAEKLSSIISSSGSMKLLSGGNNLSGMYDLLGSELALSTQAVESLFTSSASSNAIQSYAKTLNAANVASLLDITA